MVRRQRGDTVKKYMLVVTHEDGQKVAIFRDALQEVQDLYSAAVSGLGWDAEIFELAESGDRYELLYC